MADPEVHVIYGNAVIAPEDNRVEWDELFFVKIEDVVVGEVEEVNKERLERPY